MRQPSSNPRWATLPFGAMALCLAAGCAGPAHVSSAHLAPAPASRAEPSVLFTVRFDTTDTSGRGPAGLVVGVDDEAGFENLQFAFGPNSRVPGRYAEFLVRLDVRAGPYRIRRISGVDGRGVISPRYDAPVDLAIVARARSVDYLGRIEVVGTRDTAAAPPRIGSVDDRYDEDMPEFVHAWPALRARTALPRGSSRRAEPAVANVSAGIREP